MRPIDANLVEIFYSAQGEGPYVGWPTLFVRFGECDLRCGWCDSPGTWLPAAHCRVEIEPGSGRFRESQNPVDVHDLAPVLETLGGGPGSFVSLTGGEPLLQPDAVGALADLTRGGGRRAYLETHGLAVEALEKVVDRVDVVSMDWKLESDVRWASDAKAKPLAPLHRRFLEVAFRATEVYVKVVVTPNTTDAELAGVCRDIATCSPEIPLVLQPVTPTGKIRETPDAERLLVWQRECGKVLRDVRLIPQTHRSYGAL